MDWLDPLWTHAQREEISGLQAKISIARNTTRKTLANQNEIFARLQQENEELRLRVGVLIRLLIQKNTISAEQFSDALQEAKARLAAAETPKVVPSAASLPKPPELFPPKLPGL
jgi:hypothetical protein